MKVDFNINGPICVNSESFSEYQKMVINDFDVLIHIWINENHPDGIRRLALRDALRQPGYHHKSDHTCHDTSYHTFGRILYTGNGNCDGEKLYQILLTRPKLLTEITEELSYNLQNNLVPVESVVDGIADMGKLVELLIRLSGKADTHNTHRLLEYHPVYQGNLSREGEIAYLFHLWSPNSNMPIPIRDKAWATIEKKVKAEIADNRDAIIADGDVIHSSKDHTELIETRRTLEIIRSKSYYTTAPCLRLLETELPEKTRFLDLFYIIRILIKLEDERLALKIARRHLITISTEDAKCFNDRDGRIFIYWLLGMIASHTPDDKEFFNTIAALRLAVDREA